MNEQKALDILENRLKEMNAGVVVRNFEYDNGKIKGELDLMLFRKNGRIVYFEYKSHHKLKAYMKAMYQFRKAKKAGIATDFVYATDEFIKRCYL